ncbi:MAG: chitobiase/beta-hexosaminidase C-terminal domain-containing protein [Mogibacterium sp.]|nr:chitobiase/beta-hexosaminidase C-terminal domain-containing protein [Mogibacterium sp.]
MKTLKKRLSLLLILAMTLTMSMGIFTTVFAEEEPAAEKVVLRVLNENGASVEFTMSDLQAMTKTVYFFSGINNYGTVQDLTKVTGVKLRTVLRAAGITDLSGKDLEITDNSGISINKDMKTPKKDADEYDQVADPYIKTYSCDVLFAPRYCYSNLDQLNAVTGKVKTEIAEDKMSSVDPLIDLSGDTKLYFGQAYPTERNWPETFSNIACYTYRELINEKTGIKTGAVIDACTEIKVLSSGEPKTFGALVIGTEGDNLENVPLGTELDVAFENNKSKGFIYYTKDGSDPDENSYIYNYAPKLKKEVNKCVLDQAGEVTVKAYAKGFGSKDSDVAEKTYTVDKGVITAGMVSLSASTYTYTGKAKTPAVIINGLVKGTDYTVSYANNTKVGQATVTVTGIGNYEGTVTKNFIIKPAKATVSKIAPARKALTVTVKSQKASGITGYKIYYKASGASKWSSKALSASKTSLKIKNLKSKKYYYVKTIAYKTVGSKTYYGAYSTTKKVKTK